MRRNLATFCGYRGELDKAIECATEILQIAEDEGRRRGCRSAVLYTISFQAPGFYERNGWAAFGEVPCDPPGTTRVFMSKHLT